MIKFIFHPGLWKPLHHWALLYTPGFSYASPGTPIPLGAHIYPWALVYNSGYSYTRALNKDPGVWLDGDRIPPKYVCSYIRIVLLMNHISLIYDSAKNVFCDRKRSNVLYDEKHTDIFLLFRIAGAASSFDRDHWNVPRHWNFSSCLLDSLLGFNRLFLLRRQVMTKTR